MRFQDIIALKLDKKKKKKHLVDREHEPIPVYTVPTTPWSVPSAPAGAKRAAYEMAAELDRANVMPLSSSTGSAHRGFVMNEYEEKMTVNVKNTIENMVM